MDKRLTILIDSFDGYSDVWPYFFSIFSKYWNNCPYDTFLVSNNLTCEQVKTLKTGDEIDWINRTMCALQSVDSSYVMLLLEDYFLSKPIDNNEVNAYLDFVITNNLNYLRLIEYPKTRMKKNTKKETYIPIYENEEYGVNLQAAIWKKDFLIKILTEIKHGSAWQFEVELLKNTINADEKPMIGCYTLKKNPFGFHNGILKGKWFPKEIRYYKRRNIDIDFKIRGKLSFLSSIKYYLVVFVKNSISYKMRKKLKNILRKLGFKFVSDL